MRNFCLFAAAGVVAILLQTTVLHLLAFGRAVPDLVLVLCVYLALRHRNVGGVAGAFFLGYFLDTFSGADLGINAFAMTLVFLSVHLLSRRLWIEGPLSNAAVVFLAASLKALAIVGLIALFSDVLTLSSVRHGLIDGGIAAALAPFVFAVLNRGKRWLGVA
jgi:rod shape-determining protein MreD